MNSCLYRCTVMHKRDKPKLHRFSYKCFVFCIDLDELDNLSKRLRLFSHNRRNAYALMDRDHFRQGADSLKGNVVNFLRAKRIEEPISRIELVTNLRTWGHVFNPVSFFFVYKESGGLLCCVAEVANTFHEQKLYLVSAPADAPNRLRQSHAKLFYISPFSEPDTTLHFDLQSPGARLKLVITESDADGTYFYSALQGERLPLGNRSLLRVTLRFPFMTLRVIAAIHWQAARLYFKRVPFFRKTHRPDLQTETRDYLKKDKRSA